MLASLPLSPDQRRMVHGTISSARIEHVIAHGNTTGYCTGHYFGLAVNVKYYLETARL